MSIFVLVLLVILFNQPKDARQGEVIKNLIGIAIACGVLGLVLPVLGDIVGLAAIGGIGYFIYKTIKRKKEEEARRGQYGWDPQRWNGTPYDRNVNRTMPQNQAGAAYRGPVPGRTVNPYPGKNPSVPPNAAGSYRAPAQKSGQTNPYARPYGAGQPAGNRNAYQGQYYANRGVQGSYTNPQPNFKNNQQMYTTLPASVKKRKKLVESFNEKYTLFLTDEQISSMVSSSYMSAVWKRELEAMDRKYETVHQWFQGPTAWLRIYMHAFHVQEITSDIQEQENIVIYAFETVFNYVDSLDNMSLSQKIAQVNQYFMTSFDDISFMGAYRYLEAKGLRHDLSHHKEPLRNEDPVEDLVRKYETE